jgi:hypothetical protein
MAENKSNKSKAKRATLNDEQRALLDSIGLPRTKNFTNPKGPRESTKVIRDAMTKAAKSMGKSQVALVVVPTGVDVSLPTTVKVVKIAGNLQAAKSAMVHFNRDNGGAYSAIVSQGCLVVTK